MNADDKTKLLKKLAALDDVTVALISDLDQHAETRNLRDAQDILISIRETRDWVRNVRIL